MDGFGFCFSGEIYKRLTTVNGLSPVTYEIIFKYAIGVPKKNTTAVTTHKRQRHNMSHSRKNNTNIDGFTRGINSIFYSHSFVHVDLWRKSKNSA